MCHSLTHSPTHPPTCAMCSSTACMNPPTHPPTQPTHPTHLGNVLQHRALEERGLRKALQPLHHGLIQGAPPRAVLAPPPQPGVAQRGLRGGALRGGGAHGQRGGWVSRGGCGGAHGRAGGRAGVGGRGGTSKPAPPPPPPPPHPPPRPPLPGHTRSTHAARSARCAAHLQRVLDQQGLDEGARLGGEGGKLFSIQVQIFKADGPAGCVGCVGGWGGTCVGGWVGGELVCHCPPPRPA